MIYFKCICCGRPIIAEFEPKECPRCHNSHFKQYDGTVEQAQKQIIKAKGGY